MTSVKVYQPDLRVTLYKTIKRTTLDEDTPVSARFQGIDQKIDLTPFLSESSGLRTSKSVREAAGGFSITVGDKPYKGIDTFETLYGVIEPMDFIEIRVRHSPPDLIGNLAAGADDDPTRPPIVMRGFVSKVDRNETMGADGKPQRSVVINGQDYGKLWQMLQILYLPGYVIGQDILSNFKLFERFGVGFQTAMKGGEFVTQMIQKVVNPYLKKLMPENSPNPTEIQLDISAQHGTTSITGPQNQEGTIYDLMRTYTDVGIWNELYLEDREDGVFCVYRPNPAQSVDGKPIQDDAPEPTIVDLPDVDVLSMSVSRSDTNVANFYWVRAPRFEMVGDITMRLFAIQGADKKTVLLEDYPNTKTSLYGLRVMYGQTEMGGDDVTTFNSGQKAADSRKRDSGMASWIADRRRIMVEQNKDNVVLESGTMRVRGNEQIRAGCYVRIKRGTFNALYYVVQVDHDYIPFNGFFSTLTVERGMGFVERAKRGGGSDSPYLSELLGTLNG
ncbi:hypothetical protein [Bordetella phage vB_BbrM_PHB04]|uniref:Uncharacterized protein n=1 Tax=Bordetella phage vB_BbrM_PHB04 TaxID=2029657 RepID=A0A291L9U8_9CAUD|nr:hypothetical protein HOS14_gp007 [Bordetella phage vB_BbrM_PHB04]ATI15625.1 hypothetical protein [Bordetella phage vB_BbrM_PHB04]